MKGFGTGALRLRGSVFSVALAAILTAGCGGGGGGDSASSANSKQPTNAAGNRAPSIQATPAAKAAVGTPYIVTPSAQDPDGDALAFSIENCPEWAQFSTVTGQLTGTPTSAHVGTYADITISVSDGKTTSRLAPFSVSVTAEPLNVAGDGAATLSWELPTLTIDGAPFGALAGFRIHYGKTENALTETIEVQNPGIASYVVDNLPPGKYFFAVRAISTTGAQSPLSNVIATTIS